LAFGGVGVEEVSDEDPRFLRTGRVAAADAAFLAVGDP
jgi:hypothetical protein